MAKLPMPVVEKPSPSHGIAEKQDMSLDSWETIYGLLVAVRFPRPS